MKFVGCPKTEKMVDLMGDVKELNKVKDLSIHPYLYLFLSRDANMPRPPGFCELSEAVVLSADYSTSKLP